MKELKIASVQDQYHELEAPLPVGLVPTGAYHELEAPLPVGLVPAVADHELEAPLPVGLIPVAGGPLPVGLVLPAAEAKHALSVSGI